MALKRFPAEEEYKRNKHLTKESVAEILKWVNAQAYLPKISEEDAIQFLVSCKFDMQVAQKTLSVYYTFKSQHPELFYNEALLNEDFNLDYTISINVTTPEVTHEQYKVMYMKIADTDVSHFNFIKESNVIICHHDLMLYEAGAVAGWRIVFDMEDTTFSILTKFNPFIFKHGSYYFQEACPVLLKGIHIVRPRPFVKFMLKLIKPFLNTTTAEYLQVHDNLEDLYKYVPKEFLPSDVGGYLDSSKNLQAVSNKRIMDNRDILIQIQNQRSDESKRPRSETSFWSYLWG